MKELLKRVILLVCGVLLALIIIFVRNTMTKPEPQREPQQNAHLLWDIPFGVDVETFMAMKPDIPGTDFYFSSMDEVVGGFLWPRTKEKATIFGQPSQVNIYFRGDPRSYITATIEIEDVLDVDDKITKTEAIERGYARFLEIVTIMSAELGEYTSTSYSVPHMIYKAMNGESDTEAGFAAYLHPDSGINHDTYIAVVTQNDEAMFFVTWDNVFIAMTVNNAMTAEEADDIEFGINIYYRDMNSPR